MFFWDEALLWKDEWNAKFSYIALDMTKLRTNSLIHIFALLHFGTAVLCKSVGMNDTLLLTLLTMTLTVLICLRERLTLEFTAAAIVAVNIVGYFAGIGLAWVFNLFTTSPVLQAGLATLLTTEFIGWGLTIAARSKLGSLGKETNLIVEDKQLAMLVIAIAIVYIIRVLLDLYSSGESSRGEILGNSLALLIFVADVIFISRSVTKALEAEREKGDEARLRYTKLKQHVNDLQTAVERYRKTGKDDGLDTLLKSAPGQDSYKERFLVRVGDKIIPVQTTDIVCFVSFNKGSYLVCFDGARYAVNPSLDEVSETLDPSQFFRISRSAIVAKKSVVSADRQPNGKLILEISLPLPGQEESGSGLEVSRARVDAFLEWLEA